ncbi:hypothetical protein BT63DRAFT_453870 [Microthyrium microscopicum]|uniref:Actin-like ATPase domain-containing protein n=1 Tax=Microthyrium microscopicum TaxID=703497 RepID=A0A6A6UGS9_9PEZI|nr:hypothetical protein BT63DRAFT_453870 [Microthyrium microscopicum]
MADIDAQTDNGPRIVLGIDYGTTFTGLAWMQTTGHDSPGISNINTYRSWPAKDAPKVPSAKSYSKAEGRSRNWGYDIDDKAIVMRWTKLELEPKEHLREELAILQELVKGLELVKNIRTNPLSGATADVPVHVSKSSEDIVRDYLRDVAREWYQHVRAQGQYIFNRVPLDIVITHPASWSYEARNKTYRAVRSAFSKVMFPTLRNVSFVSEPEASALTLVQDLLSKDRNSFIPGESFVLCDAGGGTVDLVSYRIDRIEPLKLTRVGTISGSKVGAIFVDRAFLEWADVRLKNLNLAPSDYGNGGHFAITPAGKAFLDRFERIKHAFNGTGGGEVQLPRGTEVEEAYQESCASGVLTLTKEDVSGMFEKSVRGTVELIARQIVLVEQEEYDGERCDVKNIFLSGGFAESPYLYQQAKDFADTKAIDLQRADDCWSAVVRGAVLKGMGVGADLPERVKECPRHYGICVSDVFAAWKYDGTDTVKNTYNASQMVHHQVSWLIKKGDVILPDKAIKAKLRVVCQFTDSHVKAGETVRVIFAATNQASPSRNLPDLPIDKNEVVSLDVDLSKLPRNKECKMERAEGRGKYYQVNLVAELEVRHRVTARLMLGDTVLAKHTTTLNGSNQGTTRVAP